MSDLTKFSLFKRSNGFYYILFYKLETPGDTLLNLQRTCKFDDNVFRLMTTKVPLKKKGEEIKPLVPAPGHLADFSMELRPQVPRRRHDGPRGPRPSESYPPRSAPTRPAEATPAAPAAAAAPEPAAAAKPSEAPATETKTETPAPAATSEAPAAETKTEAPKAAPSSE